MWSITIQNRFIKCTFILSNSIFWEKRNKWKFSFHVLYFRKRDMFLLTECITNVTSYQYLFLPEPYPLWYIFSSENNDTTPRKIWTKVVDILWNNNILCSIFFVIASISLYLLFNLIVECKCFEKMENAHIWQNRYVLFLYVFKLLDHIVNIYLFVYNIVFVLFL